MDVSIIGINGSSLTGGEREIIAKFTMIPNGQVSFNGCERLMREVGKTDDDARRIDYFMSKSQKDNVDIVIQKGKSQETYRVYLVDDQIISAYSAK